VGVPPSRRVNLRRRRQVDRAAAAPFRRSRLQAPPESGNLFPDVSARSREAGASLGGRGWLDLCCLWVPPRLASFLGVGVDNRSPRNRRQPQDSGAARLALNAARGNPPAGRLSACCRLVASILVRGGTFRRRHRRVVVSARWNHEALALPEQFQKPDGSLGVFLYPADKPGVPSVHECRGAVREAGRTHFPQRFARAVRVVSEEHRHDRGRRYPPAAAYANRRSHHGDFFKPDFHH